MKKTYFIRLVSLIFAAAIITGCSKNDQLLPQQTNSSDKMIKALPLLNGGIITGKFTPAPDYCLIRVYNEAYSKEFVPEIDGSFKLTGLPAGTYNLMVSYAFILDGYPLKTYYLEIFGVIVREDAVTDLGLINLPVILH